MVLVIEKCLESTTVVQIDKESKTLNTDSERTTPLEEDEDDDEMFEDDLSNKPITTETFVSCSPRATRVHFDPMASLYLNISLDEYTQEEIEETFWTPNQMKCLNKEQKRTVKRMEAGLEEKRSATYRGLEKSTIWGYQQRSKSINAYVNTVLDEMERQWMEDNLAPWDWEKIASLTEETTKQSAQEAIEIALSDEKEARAVYKTMKVKTDMMVRQPQKKKKKLGKCVSNVSAFFGQVRSGLEHPLAGRRTSKVRQPKNRLESFIQIAEGQDNR